MERSGMESFRNACNRFVSIVHSSGMRQHQIAHWMRNRIPWDAYLLCDICRHFASVMLHFASLISHNLRCIPAYTLQIPTGFFSIITKLSQGQLVYHLPKQTHTHTIREIYHPQKNPWNPWDLCEPKKTQNPHTIREIYHPQKKSVRSVRSVWAKEKKCYFSSRSATA